MDWARDTWDSLRDAAQDTLARVAVEWSETRELAPILNKLLHGEDISDEEKEEITAQAADIGRIVGLGAVKMIPFAGMPLVALIIYSMKKMDLQPLPSAWDEDPEAPSWSSHGEFPAGC
ncbi:MAG: hypothetical protein QGG40_10175 [Myxococcota bacterium]|jgi:hypothetical protein|nr:hypothetical protein [Myxococcota bacterium]